MAKKKNEEIDLGDFLNEMAKKMREAKEKYEMELDIKFPKEINGVKKLGFGRTLAHAKNGAMVKVRPVDEQYGNKTFLGLYLGDLPVEIGYLFNKETKNLEIFGRANPAIFVPKLGKIIYGFESWWGEVKSEEELKEITDEDIMNVWYVKALRESLKKKEND